MNILGFDGTFAFQLLNTMLLLAVVLGIPYLLIRLVFRAKKMEKRLEALEGEVERLKNGGA